MAFKPLQSIRVALSIPSTSVQLCCIGLMGGIVAACVIILFKLFVNLLQISILGSVGNYTSISSLQLFILPLSAASMVLLIAKITDFKRYRLGIPFVIHRFKLYYGHIPFVTTVNQFFGGVLALASGFVVGKEGPTVHLAAATSHYIGRWFKLPYNSLRILSGCGIAAGIAAAFNTPFAAVIFVMEVVMRQYKVHMFVPIMLSAACGSVLTRLVFGDSTALSFLNFESISYAELPLLIIFGMFLGFMASLFNTQLMFVMKICRPYSMTKRLLFAGFLTGAAGYFMPQALGTEFSNVNSFIDSQPLLISAAIMLLAKYLLANIAISLGVPGGIIGAVMVIGMMAGVLFATFFNQVIGLSLSVENFALLGLAGLLAAVLSAPMAALSAAIELSMTQKAVLPAIITIVSAYVTSKQLFKNRSIFIRQLEFQGLSYTTTAIRNELQSTGVLAICDNNIHFVQNESDADMTEHLRQFADKHIVQRETSDDQQMVYHLVQLERSNHHHENIKRTKLSNLHEQHTLAEVYEALYLQREGGVLILNNKQDEVVGIITWKMLHNYLLRHQH